MMRKTKKSKETRAVTSPFSFSFERMVMIGMDNYVAIEAIEAYIYDNLFGPSSNWPKNYFRKRSYERYAAEKILSLIACGNGIPALVIVEKFIKSLRERDEKMKETDHLFSIMLDVATDIYDILRAMQ